MNKILLIAFLGIFLMASVMANVVGSETLTVVSSNATSQVFGPLDHYAGISSPDWGISKPAILTWVHSLWPSIPGASWISSAYYVEDPTSDSWRLFERTIEIPACAKNIQGTVIMVGSDNAEVAYLNGALIGHDGTMQGPFVDNYEWNTVLSYNMTGLLPGTNTLQFIVRNYALDNSNTQTNPTGLIYKTDITYDIDPQCEPIVPEYGTVIGIFTAISAVGIFFFLRK
jgi:hypothetical protein